MAKVNFNIMCTIDVPDIIAEDNEEIAKWITKNIEDYCFNMEGKSIPKESIVSIEYDNEDAVDKEVEDKKVRNEALDKLSDLCNKLMYEKHRKIQRKFKFMSPLDIKELYYMLCELQTGEHVCVFNDNCFKVLKILNIQDVLDVEFV